MFIRYVQGTGRLAGGFSIRHCFYSLRQVYEVDALITFAAAYLFSYFLVLGSEPKASSMVRVEMGGEVWRLRLGQDQGSSGGSASPWLCYPIVIDLKHFLGERILEQTEDSASV